MEELKAYLEPGLKLVSACMDEALQSGIGLLDSTNRSLREHSGKMMRPMLALLVAGAAGTPTERTYRYAAATELLHNATLLHDDVVDGATQRRGIPTVASLLGGSAAVLIGDYWLVQCLRLVLKEETPDTNRVLRIFSETLGNLTRGELLQMQKATEADTTEADYLRIIYGKTASLFESAATTAALSVGADEKVVEAMGAFARTLGLAFQIKDDIFDYYTDGAAIGKPVGIDLREQKITQPLLCALEKATPEEEKAIREKVKYIPDHPEYVEEITAFVKEKDGVALAREKMDFYVAEAISCLEILPESKEKLYLAKLAEFVGKRSK